MKELTVKGKAYRYIDGEGWIWWRQMTETTGRGRAITEEEAQEIADALYTAMEALREMSDYAMYEYASRARAAIKEIEKP